MTRLFGHYIPKSLLVLILAEASIVWGSVYAGRLLPYAALPEVVPTWGGATVSAAAVLTFFVLISMEFAGLWDVHRRYDRGEHFLRLAMAFALAYLLVAVVGYLLPIFRLSRMAFLLSMILAFPPVFFGRVVHDSLTGSSGVRRKVLLIGAGRVSELISKLATSDRGYEIIGCIDGGENGHAANVNDSDGHGNTANGLKVLGTIDDFAWTMKTMKPDVVVAAMEERRTTLPIETILEYKLQGVEVEDWPAFYEKLTTKLLVSHIRPSWLAFSDGFRQSRVDDVLRRILDIVVSAIGGLFNLPVLAVLAVLIKLDSRGPVFFRQERVGKSGRVFVLLKLRTMRVDAEVETGPVWAQVGDTRVTRLGRVLRKMRLDELPQFINVLRGDMSLVGPRPERPIFVSELQERIPFYIYRHVVRPGMTGWAQVRYHYGASVEHAREKLEYDLYYIKNRSLFLDLLIIVQTIQVVVFGRGAR
jgi:sugar transferase (PEP-CTERM system associated)